MPSELTFFNLYDVLQLLLAETARISAVNVVQIVTTEPGSLPSHTLRGVLSSTIPVLVSCRVIIGNSSCFIDVFIGGEESRIFRTVKQSDRNLD